MRIHQTWLVAGFVGGLLCAAACGESTTDDDTSTGGSTSSVPRFGTSPCAQCVESACASERSICLSEPSCAAYLSCVDDCKLAQSGNAEPNCELACPDATDPAGQQAEFDLSECRLNGAGAECPECGIVSSSDQPLLNQECDEDNFDDACGICLDDHCCDSLSTCAFMSDCLDLGDCISACDPTDVPCTLQCYEQYPDALGAYAANTDCVAYYCKEPCIGEPGDPCMTCAEQKCTNSWLACDLDVGCFLITSCYGGCQLGDVACTESCREGASPETLAVVEAHLLCLDHACPAECAVWLQ